MVVKTKIPGYSTQREDEVIVEIQHKYSGGDILKEIKVPIWRVKEIKILKELGYGQPEA